MASGSEVRAGGAFVEFFTKGDAAVQAKLKEMQARVQRWGTQIIRFGAVIAAAGAIATAPFLTGLGTFSDWGGEMTSTMRQTGMGFEELDTLMDGMRVSGEQVIGMSQAMSRQLVEAITNPASDAAQAIDDMGVSLQQLQSMGQADRMMTLADAIARTGDESQRMARMRMFFRTQDANITGGRAGIQGRAARADEVEGVQTREMLASAQAYNGALRELKMASNGLWMSIGAAAAPAMTEFFQMITKIIIDVRKWTEENRGLLDMIFRIADKVVLVGAVIGAFGGAVYGAAYAFAFLSGILAITKAFLLGMWAVTVFAATGFGVAKLFTLAWAAAWMVYNAQTIVAHVLTWAWIPLLAAVGIAFSLIPIAIGLVIVGIVAFVGYLLWSRGVISDVWDWIVDKFDKSVDAIGELLDKTIEFWADQWDQIADIVSEGWDYITSLFGGGEPGFFSQLWDGFTERAGRSIEIVTSFFGRLVDTASTSLDMLGGAFSRTFDGAANLLTGLVATASTAFQGMQDALAIGDWEMLWEILKSAAMLAFTQVTGFVHETWLDWKFTLMEVFYTIKAFVIDTFESIWIGMKASFALAWGDMQSIAFLALAAIARAAADNLVGPLRDEALRRAERFTDQAGMAEFNARDRADNIRNEGQVAEGRRWFDDQVAAARRGIEQDAQMAAARAGNQGEADYRQAMLDTNAQIAAMNRENAQQHADAFAPTASALEVGAGAHMPGTFSAFAASAMAGGSMADRMERHAEDQVGHLAAIRRLLEGREVLVMG